MDDNNNFLIGSKLENPQLTKFDQEKGKNSWQWWSQKDLNGLDNEPAIVAYDRQTYNKTTLQSKGYLAIISVILTFIPLFMIFSHIFTPHEYDVTGDEVVMWLGRIVIPAVLSCILLPMTIDANPKPIVKGRKII